MNDRSSVLPTEPPAEGGALSPLEALERLEAAVAARVEVLVPQVVERVLGARLDGLVLASLSRVAGRGVAAPRETNARKLLSDDPAASSLLDTLESQLTQRDGQDRRRLAVEQCKDRGLAITPAMLSRAALDELLGTLRPDDFGRAFPQEIWAPAVEARRVVG